MRRLSLTALSLALPLSLLAACGSESTNPGSGGNGAGGSAPAEEPTRVVTDKGPVQGKVLGETRAFLGIPFAAPPVGELRWKSPQPAGAWTDTRDATAKGAPCIQNNALGASPLAGASEDCLTVNVWAPREKASSPRSVMVWIHGGGFVLGSGGEITYDGQALSEATGNIVITLNYRLGALGFMAHSALFSEDPSYPSAGMYGFEDQRAALEWVKANAAAFGGSPDDVTLFGESAGAISTCLHLISPRSKGLFQRAILESGVCNVAGVPEKTAEAQGDALATAVGCTDPATVLACLRDAKPEAIFNALPGKKGLISGAGVNWFPMVDGVNIPDQPGTLLNAGSFAKVPVILGTNKNEGTLFFAIGATAANDAEFAELMESLAPGHGAEIVAKYPSASFPSTKDAAAEAFADGAFVCPTRSTARALAKGGAPAFLYQFQHAVTSSLFTGLGVFHSSELPFIFGNSYLGVKLGSAEQELSKAMVGYWSSLARTGDPGEGAEVAWPRYDASGDQVMILDLKPTVQKGLKNEICDFWDGLAP